MRTSFHSFYFQVLRHWAEAEGSATRTNDENHVHSVKFTFCTTTFHKEYRWLTYKLIILQCRL